MNAVEKPGQVLNRFHAVIEGYSGSKGSRRRNINVGYRTYGGRHLGPTCRLDEQVIFHSGRIRRLGGGSFSNVAPFDLGDDLADLIDHAHGR
jgi:hypothetical protein